MMPSRQGPKPANLPSILAVLNVIDGGPCDGQMTATCPHCGAEGRYIIEFLCDDGSRRGAMKGCFQLFKGSNTRTAKLVQEAFARNRAALDARPVKPLASWWRDMLVEVEDFRVNGSAEEFPELSRRIFEIEDRRQAWLKKNGFGRGGRM